MCFFVFSAIQLHIIDFYITVKAISHKRLVWKESGAICLQHYRINHHIIFGATCKLLVPCF